VNPEIARAWVRIIRDLSLVLVGTFILLHETLVDRAADPLRIGAGLVLLGLPPALRADEWLRGKDDDGSHEK